MGNEVEGESSDIIVVRGAPFIPVTFIIIGFVKVLISGVEVLERRRLW